MITESKDADGMTQADADRILDMAERFTCAMLVAAGPTCFSKEHTVHESYADVVLMGHALATKMIKLHYDWLDGDEDKN